jgi:purine-nucleoside/S-methyl-5'-thioadenosine phosphorylase / adenosine deaminase
MGAGAQILKIPGLEAADGLVHGFSTLALGSVGLTHAPDREPVIASRRDFARALGVDRLTVLGAVHGASVARVDEPQDVIDGFDALITDRPGVALFATYADCYPVLLWDPHRRSAALVHAGWRGTLAGVAVAAVQALRDEYGSDPRTMAAGIGPGICGRCYEVGEEVASRFERRFVSGAGGGRFHLDLAAAIRAQLDQAGVPKVHVLELCTKETAFLPSHRRSPDGMRFGGIVAIR